MPDTINGADIQQIKRQKVRSLILISDYPEPDHHPVGRPWWYKFGVRIAVQRHHFFHNRAAVSQLGAQGAPGFLGGVLVGTGPALGAVHLQAGR